MPTFVRLIEPTKKRYRVKLYENLSISFQVMGNFFTKKIRKWLPTSKFKVKYYQNLITSGVIRTTLRFTAICDQ